MVCIKALRSCEEPGNDAEGARVNSKLLIAGRGASEPLLGLPSPFPESGLCVPPRGGGIPSAGRGRHS